MFLLQTFFGKPDQSFALLSSSAEQGLLSVAALQAIIQEPSRSPNLDAFADSRRKVKAITEEIREALAGRSAPTNERDEVAALSVILYKVPKTIEKFAERYGLNVAEFSEAKFDVQVGMLDEAFRIVVAMFQELKANNVAAVSQQNFRLRQIEGDADKLMIEQLRGIYSGRHKAVAAMALKDLHEILEKAIDHCRDAGNVIAQVVLKQS
jgi:uncharacterized protein Yka (UPF0111/DUF47 family)